MPVEDFFSKSFFSLSAILSSMIWSDLEKAFSRAVVTSVSKRKIAIAFPVLALCGLLLVFCRALAYGATKWIALSLAFLPILLSSGLLFSLGILLVRIHYQEAKKLATNFKKLLSGSLDLLLGTTYLSIPPILAYLLLWFLLGFFFLLKEIPGIGEFFSVIFAFGPFLLILGSLLLCLLTLSILFFVTPAAALQPLKRLNLAKRVFQMVRGKILSALFLFLLALIPLGIMVGLLSLSAVLTNLSLPIADRSLTVGLTWFFVMLPFSAILTPAVVFFFNFAAESYQLLQQK
jgi:hypothetical protein